LATPPDPRLICADSNFHSSGAAVNSTELSDPRQASSSATRSNALAYLPVATGAFSLVGSALILISVCRSSQSTRGNRRQSRGKTSHVYHRIMAAMSVYDIVHTPFGSMCANLFKPRHSGTLSDGRGTRVTCTLQGFFVQWGFGCFAYGAWLSVYYMMTIRYNVQEAFLARRVEPVIHASVFLLYFGSALIASILGLINPTSHAACWIMPYPLPCSVVDSIPCVRGENYRVAILWMVLVPSTISVATILICLALVAGAVLQQRSAIRKQEERLPTDSLSSSIRLPPAPLNMADVSSSFNAGDQNRPDASVSNAPTSSVQQPSTVASVQQRRPSRSTSFSSIQKHANETIVQCVLSGCTFVNSVIWTNVLYGLLLAGKSWQRDRYWVRKGCCCT
jgi:hypothetical protein